MGSWHDYAIEGMIFTFAGSGSDLLDSDWRKNLFNNGDGFSFSWARLVFLAKECVRSALNNILVGF